jgi:hypothetical protein
MDGLDRFGTSQVAKLKTPSFCSSMPESAKYKDLVTRILHRWMALISSGFHESRLPLSQAPSSLSPDIQNPDGSLNYFHASSE